MAIDHASFFIRKVHFSEVWGLGHPQYLGVGEFFTRYITHIAPTGFFILMGLGIYLSKNRKRSLYYINRALLILGLHIFLEYRIWDSVTIGTNPSIFRFGNFPGSYGPIQYDLGVLFALSISLIFWGILRNIKPHFVLIISLISMIIPTLLIPTISADSGPVLWEQLLFTPWSGNGLFLLYPTFPWLGLTGLGLYLGRALIHASHTQALTTFNLSKLILLLLIMFGFTRLTGIGSLYGATHIRGDIIKLLSVVKYPADIGYLAVTTGVFLILLHVLFHMQVNIKKRLSFLSVFGKEPLFFYFSHLVLYALLSPHFPDGASLFHMYILWIISLPVLFSLCWLWHILKIRLKKTCNLSA